MSRSRRWLRVAVPIVVTAALLFLLLRAVRPGELLETLADVSPGVVLLAALAAFSFILARAWRYRLLLGNGQPRRMRTILAVTLSSWGASLLLPGPSGDAAFVMLARTRLDAPVAVGVGAAVLSRLLDLVSLLLIALITAPLAGVILPRPLLGGGVALALLIAAGLAGLTLLGWPADEALAASLSIHLLDLFVSLPQAAVGWLLISLHRPTQGNERTAAVEAQGR